MNQEVYDMKTNRINRLFALVMIVLIITGTTIPASLAAKPNDPTIKISNAEDLQNYFDDPAGRRAVLSNGITAPAGAAFVLPIGRNATIDLYGKAIIGAKGIEVITIAGGNLTLCDSTRANAGKITHATPHTEGRGIFIRSGSLLMTGGNITQNRREAGIDWNANGGGVYVGSGTFTMTGGVISGNTAKAGGGVYIESGRFLMTGGIISGNTADYGGGVFAYHVEGVMIRGGKVTRNTARAVDGAGGVYCFKGVFGAGSSSAAIYGNAPSDVGGGRYITKHGILFIIGAIVIVMFLINMLCTGMLVSGVPPEVPRAPPIDWDAPD